MIYEFRYYRSCYKKVIELEKRYNINKVKIFNSIQTNGINNYSLKSKAFGKFIEDIFQCWYDDIKKGAVCNCPLPIDYLELCLKEKLERENENI